MTVKVPFTPRERPPSPPKPQPDPIDIPGVSGTLESHTKAAICKAIDWLIEQLLRIKARLRQPLRAADMPEIEEEEGP